MFCEKCGREISEGASFCNQCGVRIRKQKKSPVRIIIIILALMIVAGAGGFLYFNSDGHQCKKNMKLADECIQKEEYEKALTYCEAALKLDAAYADAYLKIADIDLIQEAYGDAVLVLQRGMENVKRRKIGNLSDKLEEVYRMEAEHLVGTWSLKYNLADLLLENNGDISPESITDLLPEDIGEVKVLFEFHDDGTLSIYLDKDSVTQNVSGLTGIVGMLFPAALPYLAIGGPILNWASGFVTGEVSFNYTYSTEGETICLIENNGEMEKVIAEGGEDTAGGMMKRIYSFTINGSTLQFLDEISEGESALPFMDCPMKLERLEE